MKQFSRHPPRVGSLFLILALVAQGPLASVLALANQESQSSYIERALEEFFQRHGRDWKVRLSDDGRRVVSLLGPGTRPYRGKPSEMASQFLRENFRLFGITPTFEDLSILADKPNSFGISVEYQQMLRTLPVENARLQINFTKEGRVVQVVSSYAPPQGASDEASLTKDQAIEIAIKEFLRTTPLVSSRDQRPIIPVNRNELQLNEPPKVEEVYFATDGRPRRAYRVLIDASRPFGVKQITTDANTGAILQIRNFVHNAVDGQGVVFIPNPVNSLNNSTLSDNGDSELPVSTNPNPYYTMPLLALDSPASTLRGPFVVLENIELPLNTPPSVSGTPNFTFHRDNDNFEDVMLYYHIDRIQRYIQSLGFMDANNRRIRVDAHGLDGADNSHYRAIPVGQGYLAFGDGGVDDAEDAEVIAHEYGHAIQDNQAPGKYGVVGQAEAMGEGFGDYWAVSSYYTETLASGHDMGCVMEWGAVPRCGRRVDRNVLFNDFAVGGDPHINGQIWSATLFQILNSLGKTTADRLALQSHFNVPDNPTFLQGADAIVTADRQIFSGSHISQLCQAFTSRNIYTGANCPSPTGNQNTLVVLARFTDTGLPSSPLSATQVTSLIAGINLYLREVTYSRATLSTQTKGWLNLPSSRATYYDQTAGNMLVDLSQDVIDRILADEPGFSFTNIDRMIILTNDNGSGGESRGQREWATTGPWPYALPGAFGSKRISVSIHRFDQIEAQLTHGMGHHFGLGDLYLHEGVTFPHPFADGWGNMAKTPAGAFNNTHFFGSDKLEPRWLSSSNVRFIPRPRDGVSFDETIPIFRTEVAAGVSNRMLLQVGTTRGLGVTDRITERASYYIEARRKAGTYDTNIPATGVIVYYVNEDISQGFGPLRIVDPTPSDNDLTNAALNTGDTLSNIDNTGLDVTVLAPTGAEDFRVRIHYDPPETGVDVSILPRDEYWRSPDIWVDSPACNGGNCGFDTDNGRTETDRGDRPRVGQVNRVYARVTNNGPGIAHNVRVDFWLSDPYHGIDGGGVDPDTGGNIAFNKHFFTEIPTIASGASVPVFINWTPASILPSQPSPHSCVKVKIARVFNDTNDFNQAAQENIHSYDTSSGSPYKPVVNNIRIANPYDHPIMVFLRADNVPVGWTAKIVPEKAFLPVGGSVDAEVTIQPPLKYPICSTEHITVSAWYPSGDTLIELGGSTATVNLKTKTQIKMGTKVEACRRNNNQTSFSFAPQVLTCDSKLTSKGCTFPKRPFEHITLEYAGPAGKPIYHDVVTDANGCFEDSLVNPQVGAWTVEAEYPGNDCAGTTKTPHQPVVVFPDRDRDPDDRGRGPWLSFHLGMNFPTGEFNKTHDPGPSLTLDLEYPITKNFSAVGFLGFHYFHGEAGVPDFHYTNLSLNGKYYFPVGSWRGFVNAGPGAYFPKTGPTKFGFNVGGGLQFQLQPKLVFEVGPDFHIVDPSGMRRVFIDAKMGIAFRF